ncbi:helix-turn-helix domain-containing protein [Secundilactobacillus muriivasis]
MNRLKEVRKGHKLTQTRLAEKTGLSQNALSNYENGQRKPSLDVWNLLSNYYKLPVPYLQGVSDDRNGWDVWEENTKYSKDEITAEINRLKKNKAIYSGDTLQQQITKAVQSLEGLGKNDYNAVEFVAYALDMVNNAMTDNFYIDGSKVKFGKTKSEAYTNGSLLYKGMNNDVLLEMNRILMHSKDDIRDLIQKYHLSNFK